MVAQPSVQSKSLDEDHFSVDDERNQKERMELVPSSHHHLRGDYNLIYLHNPTFCQILPALLVVSTK